MAEATPLATGPPAAGTLSLDTAYLSNNFASLAGTNTAIQAGESVYTRSAYTYSAPGGTVAVDGLSNSALNGNNGNEKTGRNALSDTVKYIIYAAAGVVALIIIAVSIWLCVRRSKKRKQQATKQNARLTTRSSFASPMHERETMQPGSANAYSFNTAHESMDDFKGSSPGIFRTDTGYTTSSIEKSRYGADVQSVHSIPPSYGHGNARSLHQHPGDLSGATLLDAPVGSVNSHGNHETDEVPVHHMLSNVNTGLSSYKAVPPPGSRTVAPPKVEELSYPPRMQSQNAIGQERFGTPASARRQQYQAQDQQNRQYEDEYQQQYQPDHRSYSRNGASQQQVAYNSRQGPISPSYPDGTSVSGRSRQGRGEAYVPQQQQQQAPQDYFSPRDGTPNNTNREPLSPSYHSQNGGVPAQNAGAAHRYRMPPQNRNQGSQRAISPPVPSSQAGYQNPYAAFAVDDGDDGSLYSAGRGSQHHRQQPDRQRQYQDSQSYDQQDNYYQEGQYRQEQQQDYSPSYNAYRQY